MRITIIVIRQARVVACCPTDPRGKMPQFKYEAISTDGKPIEGAVDMASAYEVIESLRQQGLHVNSVEEVGGKPGFFRGRKKLTWEDLHLLNEHLLTIIQSGLSLPPALEAMAKDIENKRLKPILEDTHRQLEMGSTLEEALSRHPESFSPLYLSLVRAGETTGNLSGVLSQLSTYSKRMVELKHSLTEVLAYPVFVFTLLAGIVLFISGWVLPRFANIYAELGGSLPLSTQAFLRLAQLLRDHALWLAVLAPLGLAAAYVLSRIIKSTDSGRYLADRVKLDMPLFGSFYRASILERFSRSLGLLLSSRVSAPEGLRLASAATGSPVYQKAGFEAANAVANGEQISIALAATDLFRHSFCWILAHGEGGGVIENALLRLADSYEREVGRRHKLLVRLLGPLCLVVGGLIVGLMMLAVFAPVFKMSELVRGGG